MRALLLSILVYQSINRETYAQVPKPALRVRLNKGVFDQASTIVAGLVEYEVPRVRVPPTQQCFAEGCVQVHSFRMTSFRQPSSVVFEPYPPNQFVIRISNFDFFVVGQLGGTINIILQLPVAGTVHITGTGVSVSAFLDIQKTLNDEPYLRMTKCQIDGGVVDSRVADMGLLTDTINAKYHLIMSSQAKVQLEDAICENVYRLTQQHFSSRLAKLPSHISARTFFKTFLKPGNKIQVDLETDLRHAARAKRATDDYYDDLGGGEKKPSAAQTPSPAVTDGQPQNGTEGRTVSLTPKDFASTFNVDRLRHLMIDLTLMDASATHEDFSVGMSGQVSSTKTNDVSPYHVPFPFRLPRNAQRRMAEVVISDYLVNSILYHAHRTNSLLFHVDSKVPVIGSVLKTTCGPDEVCLADQVEEIGEAFPNKKLELIIRTTRPPVISFHKDEMKLTLEGRCLFFLEGTRQKIGVIPFSAEALVKIQTIGSLLKGKLSITRLSFIDGVDFFGLDVNDLDGLRKTTKMALENMANAIFSAGIPLTSSTLESLRLSALHVTVLPGVVLLQANVDLYSSFYNHS